MKLNAYEFERRSDELFVSHYLSTVGVVQSVALGLLAVKWFGTDVQTYAISLQGVGSFITIVLVVTEYAWWLLLIRRTPIFLDTLVPYALGIGEFVVMTYVDHVNGDWFWAMGFLGVIGITSLLNNRRYCKPELFSECAWLLPMVLRNLDKSTGLVVGMTLLMFGTWFGWEHLPAEPRVAIYVLLYCAEIVSLALSARFLYEVATKFKNEQEAYVIDWS